MNEPRVVIVTGGAGGLGRAMASRFSTDGDLVVIADINADAAATVAGELSADGCQIHAAEVDVTSSQSVEHLVNEVTREHGRVDILVNNAGFPRDAPLMKMTDDDFRGVVDVCLFSAFACSRAVRRE